MNLEKIDNRSNKPEGVGTLPLRDFSRPPSSNTDGNSKNNPPTWRQNLSYYFSQFCAATSIHGVQYLGERGRFAVEKIVWTIVIVAVWCSFTVLIVKAYYKWTTSPIIVTFATTETPIYKIPFPAVTICPEVKTNPEIFNYTEALLLTIAKVLPEEEDRRFRSFSLVCTGIDELLTEAGVLENKNLTIDRKMLDDLESAWPDSDLSNIIDLYWFGREPSPETLISKTITSVGLCYTFNMLDYSEVLQESAEFFKINPSMNNKPQNWSLGHGYRDDTTWDVFPRRTFVSGIKGGFKTFLHTNRTHLDYLCGEAFQGFKVTLHHPSELPNMDKHFQVPLDQAVNVAIKPRMITASEALDSYTPEVRKCYLPNERHLRFFKSYTQQNCLHECLSNYTLSKCHCVPFYLPRSKFSLICGPGSRTCMEESKVTYLSDSNSDCSCMPSCTFLEYDVEISQTNWNWRGMFKVFSRIDEKFKTIFDYDMSHVTQLAVYYKEMQFLTSERNELYGHVDFFSNTGGLLGLFMGFSVISLIEIVYFLTLRLVCNIRRFGRDFWSGEPNLIKTEKKQ